MSGWGGRGSGYYGEPSGYAWDRRHYSEPANYRFDRGYGRGGGYGGRSGHGRSRGFGRSVGQPWGRAAGWGRRQRDRSRDFLGRAGMATFMWGVDRFYR